MVVEANVFADGHDQVACQLLYGRVNDATMQTCPMLPVGNDRWRAEFAVLNVGRYEYTVEGWIDRFRTWRGDLIKRIDTGQDVHVDFLIGARIIEDTAARATAEDADFCSRYERADCARKKIPSRRRMPLLTQNY